jgi:hypothetical protein
MTPRQDDRRPSRGRSTAAWLLAGVLLTTAACTGSGDDDGAGGAEDALAVTALSTRPDAVSGGDVLVQVADVSGDLTVTVGERDVSDAFTVEDGTAVGLIDELPEGESVVEAATSDDQTGSLTVVDHPVTGPIFSGPHLEPFACTTAANGLGEPLDEDCSAERVVRWSYVTAAGETAPLPDPAQLPADVATTEIDGTTVPLVIRTESGTIDRGVYWLHVLDPDPAAETWDRSAWNGSLVYHFGGGCGTSFSQGTALGDSGSAAGAFLDLDLLRQGYAQATNTLNTFQVQCNDVLSAEAALMTKERFTEAFGVPTHTVGEGGSGGAIQQLLIAQNYPGIIDAVVAAVPFPDALSIAPGVTDCGLLQNFYASPAGATFTDEQRAAVNGHLVSGTCGSWASSFLATIDPTTGCALPPEQIYDPATNPEGARCTLQDSIVNLLGTDDDTGFARRPIDNTGVQYGLDALEAGVITVDQFLDLNETIGGYSVDGTPVPERMEAEAGEVEQLFRTGRINTGAGGLHQVPVLLLNPYTDPLGDIHDRFRLFTILERLRLDDGSRPNTAMWTLPGGDDIVESLIGAAGRETRVEMVGVAVEWLDAIDAPVEARSPDDVAAARPENLTDVCVTPDGERHTGGDELYEDGTPCATAYPVKGDSRMAAGGPLDGLAGKCELTEVDPASYDVELTPEQEARLESVFPDGVCDYEEPGVGVADLGGTWLDFSEGPPT